MAGEVGNGAHGEKSCVCLPGLRWAKSLESVCNEQYENWFKPESMLSPSIVFFLELWMFLNFPGKRLKIVDMFVYW
jgi:hypothetical protein